MSYAEDFYGGLEPGYDDDYTTVEVTKLVKETEKAWLFDCEGDEIWLPKSLCRYKPEDPVTGYGEVSVPDWLYEEKFPEG